MEFFEDSRKGLFDRIDPSMAKFGISPPDIESRM